MYTLPVPKKGTKEEESRPRQILNRRARFDYELIETYEAGIALAGSEVKSVYLGRAHLADAYCRMTEGELFLLNCDIEPYEFANNYAPERRRDRKLLLHRREIGLLGRRSQEKGLAIVPTRMYFRNGKVKVEIALARGKAEYDKRKKIEEKETRLEKERVRTHRR